MKKNIVNLSGNNIYLDLYGDAVYYNIFNKNGYIISKQMEQKFKIFYYRYSIIFIFMVLMGDYFKSLQNTFLVGIVVTVLVEIYFRRIFLNKLKVIKNFKRERKTSKLESIVNSKEKEKIVMKACAYALLSVLLIINAIQQNFNVLFLTLSILGALYSIYIGVINVIAFRRIKRL